MIYKPISGVLRPAKWPHGLLIAHARYNAKKRRLSVTWIESELATELIERKIERYAASEKITLLGNVHGEICGYRFAKHRYKLMLPVARKASPGIIGCKRKITLANWPHGANSLLQEIIFEDNFKEIYKTNVSGTYAWKHLIHMMSDPETTPLGAPDEVYGAAWKNGSRQEYWTLSKRTYGDYLSAIDADIAENEQY